jgi:hypothetical protein
MNWRNLPGLDQGVEITPFAAQLLDEIEQKLAIDWEMRWTFTDWLYEAQRHGIIDNEQLDSMLRYALI